MRHVLRSLITLSVGLCLAAALPALAQNTPIGRMSNSLGAVSKASGQKVPTGQDLPVIVGGYINIFISLLGTVLLVYLLYGGYLWMTAAGDEKQVEKARGVIKNAIIGMIIVSLAFAISGFVIDQILNTQVAGGVAGPPPAPGP